MSATLADPGHDGYALVWDGSYFMMNSDIDSSLLTGHKLIVMVCDNGGFAVRVCCRGTAFNSLPIINR